MTFKIAPYMACSKSRPRDFNGNVAVQQFLPQRDAPTTRIHDFDSDTICGFQMRWSKVRSDTLPSLDLIFLESCSGKLSMIPLSNSYERNIRGCQCSLDQMAFSNP